MRPLSHVEPARISDTATGVDLDELDAAVESSIRAGEPGGLRVLGYGEITLVLGWPSARPVLAVKRLPVFRHETQLERYRDLLGRYIDDLAERGVATLPTELRWLRAGRELHGYLVQPLVPREQLLNRVLRTSERERGAALLRALAERVAGVVDDRVGLDAQVANWAVRGDELVDLDLSTPMLRRPDGTHELDISLFTSIYPAALRRPLEPVAHSIMSHFHEPRTVLVDVASNLLKERLDRWLPALLEAANDRVRLPISEDEVRRYFSRDRRLWLLMQRLRRLDRAWQRAVRRRPYRFLLPPPYAYGPPELPEESAQ